MRQHIGCSVEQSWLIMRWKFPAIRFENWTRKGSILMIRESVSQMLCKDFSKPKPPIKLEVYYLYRLPCRMSRATSWNPLVWYGWMQINTDKPERERERETEIIVDICHTSNYTGFTSLKDSHNPSPQKTSYRSSEKTTRGTGSVGRKKQWN